MSLKICEMVALRPLRELIFSPIYLITKFLIYVGIRITVTTVPLYHAAALKCRF